MLCVDEMSQIQALDRTQPVLPMLPGIPERRTHDYKRHGTTSLVEASMIAIRHRQVLQAPPGQGVSRFLKEIVRCVPEGLDIHVVMERPTRRRQ